MDLKEGSARIANDCNADCDQNLDTSPTPDCSSDTEARERICRVCQCAESDIRGDAALAFLNIVPPSTENPEIKDDVNSGDKTTNGQTDNQVNDARIHEVGNDYHSSIEFITPEGNIFVCAADLERGTHCEKNILIELGCSCKNELSLVHYSCALKWFAHRGSTKCEICGAPAKNVRISDFGKVLDSLWCYKTLRAKFVNRRLTLFIPSDSYEGVDPDFFSSIFGQRISLIFLWFHIQDSPEQVPSDISEELPDIPMEISVPMEIHIRVALEMMALTAVAGLLGLILIWLIAPHLGQAETDDATRAILGVDGALCILIFLIFVFSKMKYGPPRYYWIILFLLWVLVFGALLCRKYYPPT